MYEMAKKTYENNKMNVYIFFINVSVFLACSDCCVIYILFIYTQVIQNETEKNRPRDPIRKKQRIQSNDQILFQ